ncbi:hypothetical protein [Oceanobacillus damuensis]|uniref:hypothetical protein n=1 Tax=Oceanobacillus damuensis TaxID=937928 RepID=UPI0008364007|nr:hypothetical protein [Oceanobacillus damuensis]
MIKELNQARKFLNTVYGMDDKDKRALDEAKTILAKTISYVGELEKQNKELRQYVGRNIS